MKGKNLLIAVIVVAASVLVVLSFIYPEKTTEMSISGTLSREKAERHDLGRLNYNSLGISVDVNGYCKEIWMGFIDLQNNRSALRFGSTKRQLFEREENWGTGLLPGGYYMLEIEAEGEGITLRHITARFI